MPSSRSRQFRLSLPPVKYMILAALLAAVVVAAVAWYHRLVIADVEYDSCEVAYGEIVDSWHGSGEDRWNSAEYYYQTRSFYVRAETDTLFPNTAEATPSRIATGGEHACGEVDETVDTTAGSYRWQGARADDIRLGRPDARNGRVAMQTQLVDEDTAAENLATPVYEDALHASVAVNDGASAVIDESTQWWCINDRPCQSITEQAPRGVPLRGSGYQYTTDVCPDTFTCRGEWHHQETAKELITDGYVRPFDLRLQAISTYAPTVGAEMLATFRYPARVTLEGSAEESAVAVPGHVAQMPLVLSKRGPAINELTVRGDTSDTPVQGIDFHGDISKSLNALNRADQTSFDLAFEMSASAAGGCHELPLEIIAQYGSEQQATMTITAKVCVPEDMQVYTYDVQTRGEIEASLNGFTTQVASTLRDSRSWLRGGAAFEEVVSDGDFTLWLATPAAVDSFSGGCSAEYSCRVGNNVIINDQRWQQATPAWNEAGGSLRDYRHMVINHEVGHFLGQGHHGCREPGTRAPVMQQQSIDLEGCKFNPWPLDFEIDAL